MNLLSSRNTETVENFFCFVEDLASGLLLAQFTAFTIRHLCPNKYMGFGMDWNIKISKIRKFFSKKNATKGIKNCRLGYFWVRMPWDLGAQTHIKSHVFLGYTFLQMINARVILNFVFTGCAVLF